MNQTKRAQRAQQVAVDAINVQHLAMHGFGMDDSLDYFCYRTNEREVRVRHFDVMTNEWRDVGTITFTHAED